MVKVNVGAVLSSMVTVASQVLVLPAPSVAVKVIKLLPMLAQVKLG